MATHESARSTGEGLPTELLRNIEKAGILSDRQIDEIRTKLRVGDYPYDTEQLARRLVRDRLLTEYQATRLLKNKPYGLSIGKYVILEKVGSGSMGRVYKARHQLMGRLVAIKIVAPEIASNARVVARFQREMKMVGRLDHPNVVRAYDADQVGPSLYIVMEYVLGQSLSHLQRAHGPLPPMDVVRYAIEAARGLGHAHQQGIVHRDVKPSNLLLGEDGRIRVLDLGLGVLQEADTHASFATADGIAVGTIDYMSPEQACGRELDGRSDLYSLGCAMYQLISGQRPFTGESEVERLGKRINGTPVPIDELVPGLPSGLSQVMSKLLANKPSARYQTAEEVADALEAVLGGREPGSRVRSARSSGSRSSASRLDNEPAPVERTVEVAVMPDFPWWFQPLAELAEIHPLGALVLVALLGLTVFIVGFITALLIRP
jgi:serine/threonine-protein kinase